MGSCTRIADVLEAVVWPDRQTLHGPCFKLLLLVEALVKAQFGVECLLEWHNSDLVIHDPAGSESQ